MPIAGALYFAASIAGFSRCNGFTKDNSNQHTVALELIHPGSITALNFLESLIAKIP